MPRTTGATIGTHLDEFVGELIASGCYGSTGEVALSALRPLERREQQTTAMKLAVAAGDRSG